MRATFYVVKTPFSSASGANVKELKPTLSPPAKKRRLFLNAEKDRFEHLERVLGTEDMSFWSVGYNDVKLVSPSHYDEQDIEEGMNFYGSAYSVSEMIFVRDLNILPLALTQNQAKVIAENKDNISSILYRYGGDGTLNGIHVVDSQVPLKLYVGRGSTLNIKDYYHYALGYEFSDKKIMIFRSILSMKNWPKDPKTVSWKDTDHLSSFGDIILFHKRLRLIIDTSNERVDEIRLTMLCMSLRMRSGMSKMGKHSRMYKMEDETTPSGKKKNGPWLRSVSSSRMKISFPSKDASRLPDTIEIKIYNLWGKAFTTIKLVASHTPSIFRTFTPRAQFPCDMKVTFTQRKK